MKNKINLFWFRRDLRLDDNCGLFHALNRGLPVQCVFIFDKNILDKLSDKTDKRLLFIHNQLKEINSKLTSLGSSLITIYDYPENAWASLINQYKIEKVFTNHDYEPYATQRDLSVKNLLAASGIEFLTFKDQVVLEKSEVVKDDGKPYTVFTPYKNKYLSILKPSHTESYNTKLQSDYLNKTESKPIHSLEEIGFKSSYFTFPEVRLSKEILNNYASKRDFPATDGTSKVSIHLRFGTISIRELFRKAIQSKSDVWLNELIWREFYQMILWQFPHVANESFKKQYNKIPWRNNEDDFNRWCEGKTGYPIVDAGMRELNTTGFMHNRVRMITASFLVKHLLINWQWGEAYFASKLLDFDLASNNGGWQWAASSGCDAAPYFRIFNPYEQTKRFDPELKYIKKWVTDLNELTYPEPMVDHKKARERCLAVYKNALNEKQ